MQNKLIHGKDKQNMKEKCTVCQKIWQVSSLQRIPKSGYICPRCDRYDRKENNPSPQRKPHG